MNYLSLYERMSLTIDSDHSLTQLDRETFKRIALICINEEMNKNMYDDLSSVRKMNELVREEKEKQLADN